MALSLNNYLKDLSYNYYLKKDSYEISRINTSVDNMLSKLDKDFEYLLRKRFVFGSYSRGTILSRSIDIKSDVDIMVVFKHSEYERTPETYRAWLKNFADKNYKDRYGSEVLKSFPTVTVRLNNINFDLVPAKLETNWLNEEKLFIPSKNFSSNWQETNPYDVKEKLAEVNKKYNYIVKTVIRLMKAWNAKNGYPFDSYDLEMKVADMNFYNDNYQTGFFYAVNQLSLDWSAAQSKKDKLNSLRYNISKVKDYLEAYDSTTAKYWLHKVLPY
ncbi:SMODS domain-containing nucleotidyltransferase [Zunongwangia pacifica]|mgnify:CR=1 FL=1|uniref:Nucleotidyltransferase domain-containing protein n=1 Tax=Zunongwangia pacifica TaxID=2911062 RepID=A0A9X1ZQF2_9FLAO|nr:nucleotidyltransferase domain-containing protein [Zunongwangia pacifica]MCL6219102.1 nucleotidyltransferase domain-containing protein [Zunongwangia pacifica]